MTFEIGKTATFPLAKPKRKVKTREGSDPVYLRAVTQLPCVVCLSQGHTEPHHLKLGVEERGMSRRADDDKILPLCDQHHRLGPEAVENAGSKNEWDWFEARGIDDPLGLAGKLYASWQKHKSVSRLRQIIYEVRG